MKITDTSVLLVSGSWGPDDTIMGGNRDGRELFYNRGDRLMVVPVESAGVIIRTGPQKELFEMPYGGLDRGGIGYDVAPDGQGFVMLQHREHTSAHINVVFHWFEELKRLVPTSP